MTGHELADLTVLCTIGALGLTAVMVYAGVVQLAAVIRRNGNELVALIDTLWPLG